MSEIAIRVEGLSKLYHLGATQSRYHTLRESIMDVVGTPFRRMASVFRGHASASVGEDLWALKDVSFDIKRGEIVGVIGRNGAGKSTLLKVLSRITEPTCGRVGVKGRVGCLLEVGTGFHPELTGRENIFLNGAILGMPRAEILRKFGEIIGFAELEKFVDTPVKHYSSGMYTRLAFAVAAHLESDILLVDEVLAVGDAEFQKRCLGKMEQVGRQGRTVFFVSHNMASIRTLCKVGLELTGGKLAALGPIGNVVDRYLHKIGNTEFGSNEVKGRLFTVMNVAVTSSGSHVIKTNEEIKIEVKLRANRAILAPGLYMGFLSHEGTRLAGIDFKDFLKIKKVEAQESITLGLMLKSMPFLPGNYRLELHLKDMSEQEIEILSETYEFSVAETPIYGGRHLDEWFGIIALNGEAYTSQGKLL